MKKFLLLLTAVFLPFSGGFALSVGLLGSDNHTGFVGSYLAGTGIVTSYTYVDVRSATPTLASLQSYDSVLAWSNYAYSNPTLLGDVLADYVDSGGGVVLATFSFYGGTSWDIGGRILDSSYSPYVPVSSYYSGSNLGAYDAGSPFMAGVSSLSGYYRDNVFLNPGATLVASWLDGAELLAYNHGGQVAGITLYPGEVTQYGLGGDYPRIFANALNYTANPSSAVIPEPLTLLLVGSGFFWIGWIRTQKEIRNRE